MLRRLERKGERAGATIYDDYAHHPTEVEAALAALRELGPRRLIAVFQPHLYSRTKALASRFGAALAAAEARGEGLRAPSSRCGWKTAIRDRGRTELAQRGERRLDLRRVVRVVVVDRRSGALALALEASQHAGEGGQLARDGAGVLPRELDRGKRGERVQPVVAPGHRQLQRSSHSQPAPREARTCAGGAKPPKRSTSCAAGIAWARGRRAAPALAPTPRTAKGLGGSPRPLQREWWSSSTFVITATSGRSSRKLASDSSASAIARSPLPSPRSTAPRDRRRAARRRGRRAGSAPAPRSAWASIPSGRRLAVGARNGDQALLAQTREQRPAVDDALAALARHDQLGVVRSDRRGDHHLGLRRHGGRVVADARLKPRFAEAVRVGLSERWSRSPARAPVHGRRGRARSMPAPPMAMKWSCRR